MKEIWLSFVDLLKSSALVQGSISLFSIVVIGYLYLTGKPVPDTLVSIVMVILGYYFGTKIQQAVNREELRNATKYRSRANPGANRKS